MLKKMVIFYSRCRKISRYFLTGTIILLFFILVACETPKSRTQKRKKSVENGLLKAVVFKGQEPERMMLEDRMNYYRVPGLSIAAIYQNRIDWAEAYGVKEIRRPEPVTTHSLFQAASLSQPVAALAALHFVDEERIALDSNVNEFLSSWKLPENRMTRENKVTLRSLLSHCAGFIPHEFRGYPQSKPLPTLRQILDGQKPANSPAARVYAIPGSRYSYSELGYAILQQLLIDLEEKPFSQIMEESVLQPLGMERSTFEYTLPAGVKEMAVTGHLREGEPLEGKWSRHPEMAAAGLWTTPTDLALFLINVMKTARGESRKIVSAELARAMLTPQINIQGCGFLIEDAGDNLFFHMKGRNDGFECFMVAYPVKGEGVVVMTNSDNGSFLIEEIMRGVSAAYEWPHFQPEEKTLYRLDSAVYAQYVGKYEVNPEYILDVVHEDYYLVITPTGQAPTRFFAQGLTVFFSTDPYTVIRFEKDDEDSVTGLILRQRGQSTHAKKIE
ncbi:MAG: serine hydrolase domain-containing protein [Candidatus Aminicenantes bacterium]|jgi:CubicO group peptidase (beta-lactamase class C family)